jgi:hypothetical protein
LLPLYTCWECLNFWADDKLLRVNSNSMLEQAGTSLSHEPCILPIRQLMSFLEGPWIFVCLFVLFWSWLPSFGLDWWP